MFIIHISDKGLVFRIHEKLLYVSNKNKSLNRKWAKALNRHLSKKTYRQPTGAALGSQHPQASGDVRVPVHTGERFTLSRTAGTHKAMQTECPWGRGLSHSHTEQKDNAE